MSGAVVHVIHRPLRQHPRTGQRVDKYDLEPARAFGSLRFLLAELDDREGIRAEDIAAVFAGMYEYQYGRGDSLLLLGNPVLIGVATTGAARHPGGHVRFLWWSGAEHTYRTVEWVDPCGGGS